MTDAPAIRECDTSDTAEILEIVNEAAQAYRGFIPADCWHEPYMSMDELEAEINAGVRFWGRVGGGQLIGVMGLQSVGDVDLIRHAYVRPERQGRGTGEALLTHVRRQSHRRMLVGTWAAAEWAIRFYQRNGFEMASPAATRALLRRYWSITERQVETSVVLVDPSR
jgi:GNAT superfamily N-acetyltransferase